MWAITWGQGRVLGSSFGASIKHSPWLLGRLETIIEAVDTGFYVFVKIPGTMNPVNSLGKYTPLKEYLRDMQFLTNNVDYKMVAQPYEPSNLAELREVAVMVAKAKKKSIP